MRLVEFEGKKLLAKYGLSIPNGILISQDSDLESLKEMKCPVVIKAQLKAGGRGKAGAIKIIRDQNLLLQEASDMLKKEFFGQLVDRILVEEFVPHEEEFYLSCVISRKTQKYALMLSKSGGVEIENNSDKVSIIEVDPLVGLMPHHIRNLMFAADIDREIRPALTTVIKSVYRLFTELDAQIVEINPLAIVDSGCLALDGKLIIDDAAVMRHPEFAEDDSKPAKATTGFAQTMEKLGMNMQEANGDIALLTGGAGRMMATLDLLSSMGGTFRAFGELGVVVFQPSKMTESMKELLPAILELHPKVILMSICWVLANCENFAVSLSEALKEVDLKGIPMVVRICGNNQQKAYEILAPYSDRINLETELDDACRLVIKLNEGRS